MSDFTVVGNAAHVPDFKFDNTVFDVVRLHKHLVVHQILRTSAVYQFTVGYAKFVMSIYGMGDGSLSFEMTHYPDGVVKGNSASFSVSQFEATTKPLEQITETAILAMLQQIVVFVTMEEVK